MLRLLESIVKVRVLYIYIFYHTIIDNCLHIFTGKHFKNPAYCWIA